MRERVDRWQFAAVAVSLACVAVIVGTAYYDCRHRRADGVSISIEQVRKEQRMYNRRALDDSVRHFNHPRL